MCSEVGLRRGWRLGHTSGCQVGLYFAPDLAGSEHADDSRKCVIAGRRVLGLGDRDAPRLEAGQEPVNALIVVRLW
jgi:hypothetical protein